MKKDNIYVKPSSALNDFIFDEKVADVFSDMIHRSLPGYDLIISMINILATYYAEQNRSYYDLGCSLGTATISMARALADQNCKIIAVDNSEAMIKRCKINIAKVSITTPIEIVCCDLRDVDIKNAKIVLLNFTLQFIKQSMRVEILKKIHDGLVDNGILILSEKISFDDYSDKSLYESLHLAFKKVNGYSDLEISQKRTALEKVLMPDTIEDHQERLRQCGFSDSKIWYHCLNFASMIAFK